jgi:large repetitive protein
VIQDGAVATVSLQISAATRSSAIAVTNSVGSASDAQGNSLPIASAGGTIGVLLPPTITCTPGGGPRLLNQYFAAQCSATGGTPPYNWHVSSGTMPPGLSLSGQGPSAQIAGTPTAPGVYRYTISAVDSSSPAPLAGTLAFAVTIQSTAQKFNLLGSMPDVAAGPDWTTTFTLINTSASDTQSELNFLADNGNPLPLPLVLPQQDPNQSVQTTPTFDWTVASNASLIVQTSSLENSPSQSGSAQLTASAGMGGFAIFHVSPSEQEAVVPLETRNASSYLLAFDNTHQASLGVALANLAAQPASVTVMIRDDNGVAIGSGSLALPASGHTSFALSSQFPVTAGQRGTIEFDTPPGGRISALGVRSAPPGTVTTIPALAGNSTGGGRLPHVASSNGWTTTIVLVNTGISAAQFHLQFFDDTGNPLVVPLAFPQSGNTTSVMDSKLDRTLSAGATLLVQTTGALENAVQTGSAQLTSTGNISGFGIFRYEPTGQEAVVPLENRDASSYLLAFDNTGGISTGVSVSNASWEVVNVPVIIRDDSGTQIVVSAIPLSANGHEAFVLASQFPQTTGIRGTLEFTTPAGAQISVLGIRSPPTHTFTTLPAITR